MHSNVKKPTTSISNCPINTHSNASNRVTGDPMHQLCKLLREKLTVFILGANIQKHSSTAKDQTKNHYLIKIRLSFYEKDSK